MTQAPTYEAAAEELHNDLASHPTVEGSSIQDDRRPHLVRFTLAGQVIPDGVHDILDEHGATLDDVEYHGGGLLLHARPQPQWRPAGQRTIRAHGGSIVCTLSREALEASGLAEDEDVDLEAREGEVHIERREA